MACLLSIIEYENRLFNDCNKKLYVSCELIIINRLFHKCRNFQQPLQSGSGQIKSVMYNFFLFAHLTRFNEFHFKPLFVLVSVG